MGARTSGAYTLMNLREFCGTSNVQPAPKQSSPRLPRAGDGGVCHPRLFSSRR